jgi:radical SAM protein with 4Fe4S-binding SPASM domain
MSSYFLDRPEHIKVSVTNICNYKCVMCFNPTLKQARDIIKDELMYSIMDQCVEAGIGRLSIGGTGEPLLHPRYVDYIREAKRRGLWTSTTSNFSTMTKERAVAILDAGMDRMNISIYSSTPEEHKAYTKTDLFEQAAENVKFFIRTAHERKAKTLIRVYFLPLEGINSFDRYEEYWGTFLKEYGLDCVMKQEMNWAGLVKMGSTQHWQVQRNAFGKREIVQRTKIACPHIRYYLHIIHDGTVLPCCNIPYSYGNAKIEFGNANTQPIMDIWKGASYRMFKEEHARKNSNFPFCVKCTDLYTTRRAELSVRGAGDVLVRLTRRVTGTTPEDPAQSL